MKNFILLLLLSLFAFSKADAQVVDIAMPVTATTYSGSGVDTASIKAFSKYTNVSLQPIITKNSGTVAGTALPYGSLNGVNWVQIGTDTLKLTNVSVNTKIWVIPDAYFFYMVRVAGSGTMNATLKSLFGGK